MLQVPHRAHQEVYRKSKKSPQKQYLPTRDRYFKHAMGNLLDERLSRNRLGFQSPFASLRALFSFLDSSHGSPRPSKTRDSGHHGLCSVVLASLRTLGELSSLYKEKPLTATHSNFFLPLRSLRLSLPFALKKSRRCRRRS